MQNVLKIAVIAVLLIAIGYGFGRYVTPAKIVTKTLTVTQEHIHTVTVIVTKPDGTKTQTTTQDNNSVISSATSTVITNDKPQWKVAAMTGLNIHSLSVPVYGGQVERRIIGPISAGIWGLNNGTGGVQLSLEF